MKNEITFELRRLIVKGCCCENCLYRGKTDEWDDEGNCIPHWNKDVPICTHRKHVRYYGTYHIDNPKDCCMRWKQKV